MKRVLIVDDEKSFLLSLIDGLSVHRDKFQVVTAENGREAVSVLQALPVDLLVTDLKMPEMDGFELLAWVSREQKNLPVIVMTAFGTAEIEARLAEMGTLQYLEKPLDLNMLQESILNGLNTDEKSYIHGITLATFLQLMRVEQKNCTLKIASTDKVGYLYLRNGELLDAELEELSGEAAAFEIVAWENAEIEMDGTCWRNKAVITQPMEHILINAFHKKDEKTYDDAHFSKDSAKNATRVAKQHSGEYQGQGVNKKVQTVKPQGPAPDEIIRKRLLEIIQKNTNITEYVIFDQQGFPKDTNSGKCSIAIFDPTVFMHMADQFDNLISFGSCNLFSFNTSKHYQCLLFTCRGHRILLKLQPGIQPQLLVKVINNYVNR